MEKKLIIRFLKQRKRGVYNAITDTYAGVITSMSITMALEIIREDLQKISEEEVVLNYSSLAHAIKKYKRKAKPKSNVALAPKMDKWEFLDAHEITEKHLAPGKFKLPQFDARKSKDSKSKAC
jgi:hypothetical protein